MDAAENRLLMDENELDKAIDEHQKMMAKVLALTHEERMNICDMGFYNDAIKGYLIVAMRYAGFKNEEIKRALRGLTGAFDDKTADEAAAVYDNFI